MARTYTTKAGDMLDAICFVAFDGHKAGAVERVLEANHQLRLSLSMPVLPRGIEITLPDLDDFAPRIRTQALWD